MVHKGVAMTKKVYIYGNPVAQSKSPAMHTAAYKALKLDYTYEKRLVQPAELKKAIADLRRPDVAGANITVPYKSAVIPCLDELDPLANRYGAVNTIVNRHGRLVGYNTDGPGYLRSLEQETGFTPMGKKILLFGSGGAARAIALVLSDGGASLIVIASRNQAQAQELAKKLHYAEVMSLEHARLSEKIQASDLIINCTPIGMSPREQESVLSDLSVIHEQQLYSDVVYEPQETLFLQQAAAKGARIHHGLGMLLQQGVLAFHHLTGVPVKDIPVKEMAKALSVKKAK